jgi:hypothetical protein
VAGPEGKLGFMTPEPNIQILVTLEELQSIRAAAKILFRPVPVIKICAWCHSRGSAEGILGRHGFEISHGICTHHHAQSQREIQSYAQR